MEVFCKKIAEINKKSLESGNFIFYKKLLFFKYLR